MTLKAVTTDNSQMYPQDVHNLVAAVVELQTKVSELVTLTTELKTDLSGHTHGGITAGAGTSAAGPTISAATVTV